MIAFIFDGSFTGLLTAVYEFYALKHREVILYTSGEYQPVFSAASHEIRSDREKAGRVWKGLKKLLGEESCLNFSTVYLSEDTDAFRHMFYYACYIFDKGADRQLDYGNSHVMAVAHYARKVSRERHRMKAFVRFRKALNGLYFAVITPDFNVLPLISDHFKNRYADQKWLIYDKRRQYGLYYDLAGVCEVRPEFADDTPDGDAGNPGLVLDEAEELYTALWQDYFKSTCITERKNLKLHLRHVPRRYWKYLPEKGF